MTTDNRRLLLAAVTPSSGNLGTNFFLEFPAYGIHKLHAAVKAAQLGAEVSIVEVAAQNLQDLDAAIEEFRPDVLGCSAYVWSFPQLVEVARRAKQAQPDCLVLFGGPCATPSMFSLPPYRDKCDHVDALVVGEGEATLCEIMATWPRSHEALRGIHGLRVPSNDGWQDTAPRELPPLGSLGSPYQLGLMPPRRIAYLESSRGCPLGCLFCSWGGTEAHVRAMSSAQLQSELEVLKQRELASTFLIDAGLNMYRRGFNELRAAERAVDYLPGRAFTCEMYPVGVSRDHLEFLARAKRVKIGVGIQSLNPEVLRRMNRPVSGHDVRAFLNELDALGNTNVETQIILGLPGDSPQSFRRTLETLRTMPCDVIVAHALALPGGFIDRAPAELAIEFDPHTLAVSSCLGWTEKDLQSEHEQLSKLVEESHRGFLGPHWWYFERVS